MDFHQVITLVKDWQSKKEKVVLVTGTFDLYHPGHVEFLEKMKAYGQRLVVGINADDFTRKRKGPDRPVIDETGRIKQVASNRNVDAVFVARTGKWKLIEKLQPDVAIFNGTDTLVVYQGNQKEKLATFRSAFPRTVFEVYDEPRGGYSTTALVKKIRESDPRRR